MFEAMFAEITFLISLSEKKLRKLISLCRGAYNNPVMSLRSLCSLIGKLWSTSPAVTPAPLQLRYLQQCCIAAQSQRMHYESIINLSPEGILELRWWVENLDLLQGKPIHLPPPEMIICSDAAKTGSWGCVTPGFYRGRMVRNRAGSEY